MNKTKTVVAVFAFAFSISLPAVEKQSYYSQWQTLDKSGKYADAIPIFKNAVREYPSEAWFLVFLGYAEYKTGDFETGVPHIEKAYGLAPKDAGVKGNLAAGYLAFADDLCFRKGAPEDWNKGAGYYLKTARLDVDRDTNAHSYLMAANAYRVLAQHETALGYFQKFVSTGGKYLEDAGHLENLRIGISDAVTLSRALGRTGTAISFLELSARVFPNDAKNNQTLALLYLSTKNMDKARAFINSSAIPSVKGKQLLNDSIRFVFGAQDKPALAEKDFDKILGREASYSDYDLSSSILRGRVETLPYDQQMQSPWQDLVVKYARLSVDTYFNEHPYTQRIVFSSPLRNVFCVTQGAGGKSFHYGLVDHFSYDLSGCQAENAMGWAIYAAATRKVVAVEDRNPDRAPGAPVDMNAQPNYIVIDSNGTKTLYNHIQKGSALVRYGDVVQMGQRIAKVGNSGITLGPHLHFTVRERLGDYALSVPAKISGLCKMNSQAGRTTDCTAMAPGDGAVSFEEGASYSVLSGQ